MHDFQKLNIPFDNILNSITNLVQVIEVNGDILYANSYWFDTLNYELEDINSLNFIRDILHENLRTSFISLLSKLDSNQQSDLSVNLLRKDGTILQALGRFIPQVSADEIVSITCIFEVVHREYLELDRMFTMSVDMLGIATFSGQFERLNPAWEKTLGYSIDELIGQYFIDFVHPDDVADTIATAQDVTNKKTIGTFENRYLCKNGSIKWISWHYVSYPEIQKTYFVARDITEQRHHIQQVSEAKEQLQSILDKSGLVVGVKDLDGHYILVNDEFLTLFGEGQAEKLLGKTDYEIFPKDVARYLRANDTDVLRLHRTMQFEEFLPHGEFVRTYLSTKFTLDDKDGNPYAVCMIAKDITHRKATEIELLMRNKAVENSPSGISIADARKPDMPLIYVNPTFERITGYSSDESLGQNCRFLQGDDRHQAAVTEIRQAIQNQESITVILRNYRKNGEQFYNELSLAPVHDENNHLTHYVGISTDVTKRIESEHQIQQQNEALKEANKNLAIARKEAEEATRLKSQFLATMSHELRTPLNAIIGYTEIQLAGMSGDLTDEQHDYQERVLANADHLLALINDVLDIAKIEAGRLEIVRKPFNLREWVSDVESQVHVLASDKDLEFRVEVDKRLPEIMVGDPARIMQVALNLLSNAVKFTETGHIRLQLRKHGRDAWKLIVEDTGIGIPSHLQETIFEEFRQVDNTSQRKVGGTGLGLSIVRKLALMMGGNVRVKSQSGAGSVFTVFIPLLDMDKSDE